MHQSIYESLQSAAKQGKTLSYSDIAPLANLEMGKPSDRNEIARILEEISTHEHTLGKPLLSVIVVRSGEGTPGAGFYTLAKSLGVYRGSDDVAFFATELNRVFEIWRTGPKR